MTSYVSRWTVFLVAAGLSLAACQDEPAGPPPGAMGAPAVAAPFVTVTPQDVPMEETLPGRVSAIREAQVRPQVSGILRTRLFTEGSVVEEGEALYEIDSDIFRADVSASSSALSRARASLERAEQELERVQNLNQRGVSSVRELEMAQTAANVARADVQQSSAAVRRNRLLLQYAKVVAPISGRVSISRVSEGALVGPADPQPLTVIQQIDEVYVDVKQPLHRYEELQRALADGRLSQEEGAPVTILSTRGVVYSTEGKLLFADSTVDATTSEVTLRIQVPNPHRVLLPGTFVRARIPQGVVHGAIVVPQQAVRHDQTFGAFVFVIDGDDLAQRRGVTYSRIVNGEYVITEGLNAGDRVIVENQNNLRLGAPVQPQPWSASAPAEGASAPPAAPAAPADEPAAETEPSSTDTP